MSNRFLLLTAAKNEERFIATAIESVLRQSIRPVAWFIMDDGSSDHTADIVAQYAARHPFIRLHSSRSAGKRSFGAQYRAINKAYALAGDLDFDFVAMQDADIAPVSNDYFERVLSEFALDPTLGITGGYVFEKTSLEWRSRRANSPHSVAGGVQVFRRECLEQIGGYTPLAFGGEDWLAQIDARLAGWNVRALTDVAVHHYRPTSSEGGRLRGLFRLGMQDGSFGSNLIFECLKCARRVGERPVLLSCFVRLAGYLWYRVAIRTPLLSSEEVEYLRHEQLRRISGLLPFLRVSRPDQT